MLAGRERGEARPEGCCRGAWHGDHTSCPWPASGRLGPAPEDPSRSQHVLCCLGLQHDALQQAEAMPHSLIILDPEWLFIC